MKFVIVIAALAVSAPLGAQYPGQYPPGQYPGQYPPGQYPPGQGPGGGGIGIPKISRGKKNQKQTDQIAEPTFSADGRTISSSAQKLVIGTEDGRVITMTVTAQTKFTRSGSDISPSKIVPRTTVHIEAAEDDESFLTATHVDLLKDAPPEDPHAAVADRVLASAATGENPEDRPLPTILDNSVDAPDRPILRHGKPKHTESADSDSDTAPAATNQPAAKPAAEASAANPKGSSDFTIDSDSEQPRIVKSGDDLIDRAKEWAATFTNGLPNFVCDQLTTRYVEQSRSEGWQPVDIVTAKVVYEDGREDYREITVGGKRTNKSMLELGGSTSTGEFATTLRNLFSTQTQAQFKFYQSTSVGETKAAIYDFKVALHNSDWFTTVGGQSLTPEYSGSVWIEKATGQVRRIEMQADNIPKNFPLLSVEWAVDYDEVSLGTAKFFLPVHAENLGCWRRASICTKNTIDFRDYHKYSGESTIVFK